MYLYIYKIYIYTHTHILYPYNSPILKASSLKSHAYICIIKRDANLFRQGCVINR